MYDERVEIIARIRQASRDFYRRHLQSGGSHEWAGVDLTMPQLKVLFTVAASDGVTMTQLARAVGMSLSTATGVADRLIAEGMVERKADPHDRRLVILAATENGSALVDRLTQLRRAYFEAIARRLSIEDLRLVARALEAVSAALAEMSSEDMADGSRFGEAPTREVD